MDIEDYYPSKYLKASDLNGKDVVLTFSRVMYEEVTGTSGVKSMNAVGYFKETRAHSEKTGNEEKRLVMKITILRQIAEALGVREAEDWAGHRVTFYPTTDSSFGKVKDCIRARTTKPKEIENEN